MIDIIKQIKKIDKKFLGLLLFATLAPIVYSSLRLIWITDNGSGTYSMTSFNSYIQAALEVFTAFLIIPMFTYRKEDYDKSCNSMLFSIILATSFMFILLLTITKPMYDSMVKMNPTADKKELLEFLLLTNASDSISIIETYLICEIALGKETLKGVVATTLSILMKIVVDIVMISRVAVVDFTIVNAAAASLISTLFMTVILLIIYFVKQHYRDNFSRSSMNGMVEFYKRGFMPGLNQFIANFFYTFVTLSIVNSLGTVGWNSWHLGMWVYWNVIFKITSIFKFSLLSETINNEEIDKNKLTILYSGIDALIFIVLGPVLSLTVLTNVVDSSEWLKLTTTTSLIMVPFMLSISIGDKLKVRLLTDNKFSYLLVNTILSNFLIEFPVLIMLLMGHQFTYLENFTIWMAVILFSFIVTVFSYVVIIKYENFNNFFKKITKKDIA